MTKPTRTATHPKLGKFSRKTFRPYTHVVLATGRLGRNAAPGDIASYNPECLSWHSSAALAEKALRTFIDKGWTGLVVWPVDAPQPTKADCDRWRAQYEQWLDRDVNVDNFELQWELVRTAERFGWEIPANLGCLHRQQHDQ